MRYLFCELLYGVNLLFLGKSEHLQFLLSGVLQNIIRSAFLQMFAVKKLILSEILDLALLLYRLR